MKTITTVPVADYLELYEFKKSYDEGKKFRLRIGYNREYSVREEDMSQDIKNEIKELTQKKLEYSSDKFLKEKSDLESYIRRLKIQIEERHRQADRLRIEKADVKIDLNDSKKLATFLFFIIGVLIAIILWMI